MVLAQAVQAAELGQGTVMVLATVFLIPALGALVKWWMSGTEKSIGAIARSVEDLTRSVSAQAQSIAVLQAQHESHSEQIEQLRDRLHELSHEVQRVAIRP